MYIKNEQALLEAQIWTTTLKFLGHCLVSIPDEVENEMSSLDCATAVRNFMLSPDSGEYPTKDQLISTANLLPGGFELVRHRIEMIVETVRWVDEFADRYSDQRFNEAANLLRPFLQYIEV